jgi:1,2-phenylacetyl-CoA epoxidase PaaB subunit
MKIFEKIARAMAPGLKGESEIRQIVDEAIARAKMGIPIVTEYDPKGEGYRPLMGQKGQRREIQYIEFDRMFEVAYWMWDHSPMTRRMAKMDKSFLFGESFTITSEDKDLQELIDSYVERNKLQSRFPEWMMWLSLLGEQCWEAPANEHNGDVTLSYVDPKNIREVYVNKANVEQILGVELQGTSDTKGRYIRNIRIGTDPIVEAEFGRLSGECFFFSINHPPNDPRGRSDYLTLFDWIDGVERYGYNYMERAEALLNYVWDVTLKGMNEDQIREWAKTAKPPQPGSLRAHNENVEWDAVSPDIKAQDFTNGFNMGKSFVLGSAGRPDSWYGGGGKAYQTEAEQFGQVPIKDFDERQQLHKEILECLIRHQIDQAIVHKKLNEKKAEADFVVNMPEISKKDLGKLMNGIPQVAAALSIAEDRGWIRREDAVKTWAAISSQIGVEVNTEKVMEEAKQKEEDKVTEDYRKKGTQINTEKSDQR